MLLSLSLSALLLYAQERIQGAAPNAIILSGGPNSVHLEGSPRVPQGFFEWAEASKIPILGVCYGMQVRGSVGAWGVVQPVIFQRE